MFQRRLREKIEGHQIFIISLEDLLMQKVIWQLDTNSELQKQDIKRLIQRNHEKIDFNYCNNWADQLGILKEWKEIITS